MQHLLRKTNGQWYFTGANAQAVFGGPVPIGSDTGSGLDFSVINPTDVTDIYGTALYGVQATDTMIRGKSYHLSALDLAIIQDLNPELHVLIPFRGTAGADTHRARDGRADSFDGGDGRDTVIVAGRFADYRVTAATDGAVTVAANANALDIDNFAHVERLRFADGVLILDAGANGKAAYRLYQAAFARQPDEAGLLVQTRNGLDVFVRQQVDAGADGTTPNRFFTLTEAQYLADIQIARNFLGSAEFRQRYGDNPGDAAFVDLLYQNVLGRQPDAGGRAAQLQALGNGLSRAQLLVNFAESPENVALTGQNTAAGMLWSSYPEMP